MSFLATFFCHDIVFERIESLTLLRANSHKVHPIASVEVMLHLGNRTILKNGVTATCKELGIPILAYSPLGSGVLIGKVKSLSDLPEGDVRRFLTDDEKLQATKTFVQRITEVAEKRGLTPAQLSLTWIRTLSSQDDMPTIIPIPGSTNVSRVIENTELLPLLTAEDMAEIEAVLNKFDDGSLARAV